MDPCWWPPRCGDMFHYCWRSQNGVIIVVTDVLDPIIRRKRGYVLIAEVWDPPVAGDDFRIVLNGAVIMRRGDFAQLGSTSFVSRIVKR